MNIHLEGHCPFLDDSLMRAYIYVASRLFLTTLCYFYRNNSLSVMFGLKEHVWEGDSSGFIVLLSESKNMTRYTAVVSVMDTQKQNKTKIKNKLFFFFLFKLTKKKQNKNEQEQKLMNTSPFPLPFICVFVRKLFLLALRIDHLCMYFKC